MTLTKRGWWLCMIFVLVWTVGWVIVGERLWAQKAEKGTQQWLIGLDKPYEGIAVVHVIDTNGVCLYVTAGSSGGSAIAAVPKTQLPAGAGCQ